MPLLSHWDTALHPRGVGGRFSSTSGGPTGLWTDVGRHADRGADLLGRGGLVRLGTDREASTLIGKLRTRVRTARRLGLTAPVFNLCDVSVKGRNLFCGKSKGIPRAQMPQLSGVPIPGTPAAALPRDGNGEVDLAPAFRGYLVQAGHKVTIRRERASRLKATQIELNGGQVASMVKVLDSGGLLGEGRPIFISKDDYIVDGHHRWAAEIGRDLEDGKLGDISMPVERVDMNILPLLKEADLFAARMGLPSVGLDAGFHFKGSA